MLNQKFFNRFEIKYQISLHERDNIIGHITPFMNLDSHILNNYDYEVRSLYFDSLFRGFYYEKIEGIKNRVKLRIRYYPDFKYDKNELVFIELKKKVNENVIKSRILVPFEDMFKIIDYNSKEAALFYKNTSNQERKTLQEIWYLSKKYNLQPACVVSYKRQPYLSKMEKTFRITFDSNIQIRNYNYDLKVGGGSNYVVPRNIAVMEIKFNNFIPNWAIKIVQNNNCIQEKISKFANGLEKTRVFSLM